LGIQTPNKGFILTFLRGSQNDYEDEYTEYHTNRLLRYGQLKPKALGGGHLSTIGQKDQFDSEKEY